MIRKLNTWWFPALSVLTLTLFFLFYLWAESWAWHERIREYESGWDKNIHLLENFENDSPAGIGVVYLLDTLTIYRQPNDSSYLGLFYNNICEDDWEYENDLIYEDLRVSYNRVCFSPPELEFFFEPLVYNPHWCSGGYHCDLFQISTFKAIRVISMKDGWAQIVFNESKNLSCYTKTDDWEIAANNEFYRGFFTWKEYLVSRWIKTDRSNHIYEGPAFKLSGQPIYNKIDGEVIPEEINYEEWTFRCEDIKGDWMQVHTVYYYPDIVGWIKWRDSNHQLLLHSFDGNWFKSY